MEFSLKFDTVKSGWSIVDTEGSLVIISKKYCISISVPNSTKALCSISSECSLFTKVPVLDF